MIRKWEPTIMIGPEDQGREISLEDFEIAVGTEGYRYELIDGRIEVSPAPESAHIAWRHSYVVYSGDLSIFIRKSPTM